MTARMDIRFRRPVFVGQEVTAVAGKSYTRRGLWEATGRVELPDGRVAAEAVGTYVSIPDGTLASMTEGYPKLAAEWMRPR